MMDTVLNIGLNNDTVKGMIRLTGDERFVYDAYRRLVQMFGNVVMGVPDEAFEEVITETRKKAGVQTDTELTAEAWKAITEKFKEIFKRRTKLDFPDDPYVQLKLATEAVFKSWNGKRAIDYRNASGISHDLGDRCQHCDNGLWQYGGRQRHRRCHDPQRLLRRKSD